MATEQDDKPTYISPEYVSREKALVLPPGESAELKLEDCRHKLPDDIWKAEKVCIDARRGNFRLHPLLQSDEHGSSDNEGSSSGNGGNGDSSGTGQSTVAPIVGLALSGGGIRSASFSLGVMQALAKHNLLKFVDILSTVSGGGFIGSSLTWLTSPRAGGGHFGIDSNSFPYGTDDPKDRPPDPAALSPSQKMLRYLRGHGNYLTPGKGITIFSGIAVLLRGTLLNLLVWLPLMAAVWYVGIAPDTRDIFDYAGIVSGVIAALFVLFSIIYSLFTYSRFRWMFGIGRYRWRRFYEKLSGLGIRLFLLSGAIALIPVINDNAETVEKLFPESMKFIPDMLAWGGPGYIVLGLAAGFFGLKKANEPNGGGLLSKVLLGLAVVLVFWGVIVFTYQIADFVKFGTGTPEWLIDNLKKLVKILPIPWDDPKIGREIVFGALVILALVTGWFVNVNYISLHRFYRDRLMETFMPNVKDALENKTGPATNADNAKLSTFTNENGPYHIVNTNLILVNSDNKLWKRRHGDNFILSPLYCGGNATGWRKTDSFMGNRLTMATAVATSGAAANPNSNVGGKGVTINPLVGFLMALLNIRLGTWVPNPRRGWIFQHLLKPNHFWPGLYEVLKLLGRRAYNEKRVFLQLSDGGHFENTGIYELIRRRAKLIICCDGGGDQDFNFGDYQTAIDRVKTDFGVTIDISADKLGKIVSSENKGGFSVGLKFAKQGYAEGEILYPDNSTGTLILLKTTMVENLSIATLGYRGNNPSFPDETTADQFFSVEQFEAYRELGLRIGEDMIENSELKAQIRNIYGPQSVMSQESRFETRAE